MSAKMLMVFCDETDLYKGEERLYAAIVRTLHKNGIAGATVIGGFMGYGVHRRIHKKGLFGVSDERPVLVLAIDEEQKLRAILSILVPMVKEGLINLVDTEVISTGTQTDPTAISGTDESRGGGEARMIRRFVTIAIWVSGARSAAAQRYGRGRFGVSGCQGEVEGAGVC